MHQDWVAKAVIMGVDQEQGASRLGGLGAMRNLFMTIGGEVNGPGTGTSDSVPARLSDGEFVLTAKSVSGAGLSLIHI